MVHLVYKITNRLNFKYYIGVHSTLNVEDGYMGSGHQIRHAIRKYGIENFEREILHVLDSRQEALSKEQELVSFERLSDPLCYNLVIGGANGVQSTKEKKRLFGSFQLPPKLKLRFDQETFYEAKLKYPVKISNPEILTTFGKAFWDIISSGTILNIITSLYNSKQEHKLGLKYIALLERMQAFRGNLFLEPIYKPACHL